MELERGDGRCCDGSTPMNPVSVSPLLRGRIQNANTIIERLLLSNEKQVDIQTAFNVERCNPQATWLNFLFFA
jgi:hypothetical protein